MAKMRELKLIKYPKTYREPLGRILCGMLLYPIILMTAAFAIFALVYNIFHHVVNAFYSIGLVLLFANCIWLHYFSSFGERSLSKLIFYEERIVWRCFGFVPVKLKYKDIKYVGIATNDDSVSQNSIDFRGDGTAYIYMSIEPYPEKYRRKVTKLRTKKGFIKFKYTDGVAEALMDRLPSQKVEKVSGFYYHVKHIRAKEEQECAKEKLKRKRKREKRKREKEKKKAKRDM